MRSQQKKKGDPKEKASPQGNKCIAFVPDDDDYDDVMIVRVGCRNGAGDGTARAGSASPVLDTMVPPALETRRKRWKRWKRGCWTHYE